MENFPLYGAAAIKPPGKIITKIPSLPVAKGVFLAAIFPGGFMATTLYSSIVPNYKPFVLISNL